MNIKYIVILLLIFNIESFGKYNLNFECGNFILNGVENSNSITKKPNLEYNLFGYNLGFLQNIYFKNNFRLSLKESDDIISYENLLHNNINISTYFGYKFLLFFIKLETLIKQNNISYMGSGYGLRIDKKYTNFGVALELSNNKITGKLKSQLDNYKVLNYVKFELIYSVFIINRDNI